MRINFTVSAEQKNERRDEKKKVQPLKLTITWILCYKSNWQTLCQLNVQLNKLLINGFICSMKLCEILFWTAHPNLITEETKVSGFFLLRLFVRQIAFNTVEFHQNVLWLGRVANLANKICTHTVNQKLFPLL